MTRLATAIAVALVVLFAAAPAVALACGPDTGRDNSTVTLDQGVDQDGGSASTATAVIPRECVDPSRLRGAAGYVHAEQVPTYYTDPMGTFVVNPVTVALGAAVVGATATTGYYVGLGVACHMGYCPEDVQYDTTTANLNKQRRCLSGINQYFLQQSWCQQLRGPTAPTAPGTSTDAGVGGGLDPVGCNYGASGSTRSHDACRVNSAGQRRTGPSPWDDYARAKGLDRKRISRNGHQIKEAARLPPNAKTTVDMETGDVYGPNGEYIGNLNDG